MEPDGRASVEGRQPLAGRERLLARLLGAAYGLAAGGCLFLVIAPRIGIRCDVCTGGLLSISLPWMGLAVYLILAGISFGLPRSRVLVLAPGFYLLVHAALLTEMLRGARWCWGCGGVAAVALLAAGLQSLRSREEWMTPVLALSFGIAAGFFSPFDRGDDLLTRTLWPSRLLDFAPPFVSRKEMSSCGHESLLRLLIYEKDCTTCGSVSRRVVPRIEHEFSSQVCVHTHDLSDVPKGQRTPLLILATNRMRILVIEGAPGPEELTDMIAKMLKEEGAPPLRAGHDGSNR